MEILFKNKSLLTGTIHTRKIDIKDHNEAWFKEKLERYREGTVLIQDVFPWFSADDREFIKTGITPEEWERYMSEEDNPFPHDQNP